MSLNPSLTCETVLIIQPFLVLAYIEVTNISYTCRMNANISGLIVD